MSHRAPAPPCCELLARIQLEIAAPGFLRDLTMWTERQVARGLSIENRNEPDKATELVNAAIVATCDGVRRWDPTARTLRRHCEQTINSWLWHECERARRRRHIPLDTTSVDDSQDEAAIDTEMSLRREDPRARPDGHFAQREVRAKVLAALRSYAAGDRPLLALLDAYEAGLHREGEVSERLNLTESALRSLVRRYKTALRHVPPSLCADVRDVMIRDGGAPIATIARHRGRPIEIVPDEPAMNDSDDALPLLDSSSDDAAPDDRLGASDDDEPRRLKVIAR